MSPRSTPAVDVKRDLAAPLVPIAEQYAVPQRFFARVEPSEPDLPICHLTIVVERGRAVCHELRLERKPEAQALSGTALRRLPVAEYVRLAADALGHWVLPGQGPITLTDEGGTHPLRSEQLDETHVATPITGMTRTAAYQAAMRSRRAPVTDETLRQVAAVYRAAHVREAPPTRAVMEQMHVSRTTAGRWVRRARERGFLGPALPRIAGEAVPARDGKGGLKSSS